MHFMGNNEQKYGTTREAIDGNVVQHMHFACWITTATDTHSEFVILVTL